ncbi:MAG TPA: SMC-Scp complex subunit ScpB [Gammaproteobacteria bacterium]|jgi:segregation and condensation protein B|nr:SMC-Scp complex subunit ScpB [Gammaproteobacteria bacterium]
MTLPQIKNIIEAALMVSERPLTLERLMILFKPLEIDGSLYEQVTQALGELRQEYTGRGIELKEVASGFRFQARAELSPWLNQLWEERSPRYSRALLETLAIIAYRQPITRGEIEALRGVSVSSPIIRTLLEREWIRIAGHREVPGRPAVYVTTPQFLDHFNLKSLVELPLLAESPGELGPGDPALAPDLAAPIAHEAAG